MADAQTLLALADRCEREEPSRELEAAVYCALFKSAFPDETPEQHLAYARRAAPEYTRSLDAATTLIPAKHSFSLTDWSSDDLTQPRARVFPSSSGSYSSGWHHAKTPSLAICAASLRARAALAKEPT